MRKRIKQLCSIGLLLITVPVGLFGVEEQASEIERIKSLARELETAAKEWVDDLMDKGKSETERPRLLLGVVVEPVPRLLREHIELPEGVGLMVREVQEGSPAELGGIEANDILLSYNSQLLINYDQLLVLLRLEDPGAEIALKVLRKGQELSLRIQLAGEESS
jgi:serine protease Do